METITEDGIGRRDILKKAAVAGAVAAWAAPAVQVLGSGAAGAQDQGSVCPGCVDVNSIIVNDADGDGNASVQANANRSCGFCNAEGLITYVWQRSNLNNVTYLGEAFNVIQFDITNVGATASVDLEVRATSTCRAPNGENPQQFICDRSFTANWAVGGTANGITNDSGQCRGSAC